MRRMLAPLGRPLRAGIGLTVVTILGVLVLEGLSVALGAILAVASVTVDVEHSAAVEPSSPAPTLAPVSGRPLNAPEQMPLKGDCLACHLTSDGGIGTRAIPALAHPLRGWKECTACHSQDRLVSVAGGHGGIHTDECLLCHTDAAPAPRMRPHSEAVTSGCLDCHGRSAPLPHAMVDRATTNCWLCHQSSPLRPPLSPHRVDAVETCADCHRAGRLGRLPSSHDDWSASSCVTCHEASPAQIPVAPHDLSSRTELCAFCHERPRAGAGSGEPVAGS